MSIIFEIKASRSDYSQLLTKQIRFNLARRASFVIFDSTLCLNQIEETFSVPSLQAGVYD